MATTIDFMFLRDPQEVRHDHGDPGDNYDHPSPGRLLLEDIVSYVDERVADFSLKFLGNFPFFSPAEEDDQRGSESRGPKHVDFKFMLLAQHFVADPNTSLDPHILVPERIFGLL